MSRANAPVTPLGSATPSRRRRFAIVALLGLCAVGLFLLATASANTAWFAQHYRTLLIVNGGITLLLMALVIRQLVMLNKRLRARVFGARLTLRLLLLMSLMAIVPGVLLFSMSMQYMGRSIESWFDVKIDKALEGGLNLSRDVLDNMLKELRTKANATALQLSMRPAAEHPLALNALREQAGAHEAALYTARGRVIATSGNEHTHLMPDAPPAEALRLLRSRQTYAAADATPERGLLLRVVAPVSGALLKEEPRALQLIYIVPQSLAQNAETVQSGYREYQELVLGRTALKRLYRVTLSLTLLLSLLAALAAAIFLSEEFAAPLNALAEGTRAVAQGDFSRRVPVASRDELGELTVSFNSMTTQLENARNQALRDQAEVNKAKAYLESVLAHLSAGVLVLDDQLRLVSANASAHTILGLEVIQAGALINTCTGQWRGVEESLSVLAAEIESGFKSAQDHGIAEWESQTTRHTTGGEQQLLLRGKALPRIAAGGGEHESGGYVVVFDDVTHVLQAQRDAAWAEVARRLAHEIKNPLTPIQLSAERLQLKLADKLDAAGAGMLNRSTQTIVNQVAALKRMVDAFSQYARAPEPEKRELDLNSLVREVLTLYESLGSRIKLDLAPALPPIVGDAAQLRQVIHNLMQNAQDALAETAAPSITLASVASEGAIRFSVTDNGSGFPEPLIKRAFEPYVTTKVKGTGLGLSIVKKIIEEHGGGVTIANVEPRGARVSITLPAGAQRDARLPTAA
ncbi:MAG: HAMP domain-containing protein [Betaproteobacteria bacterium]|nr:HAMP domain-containing protein [Betaproteobacteria bacterium]